MGKILVTGASGAVGPTIVQALTAAGYGIRTLTRHIPPPELFPPGVEFRTGDITDPGAMSTAMEGVDAVLHLAGLLHILHPTPDLNRHYEAVNVAGTRNVTRAALEAGVRRIVYFSTIAVYGPSRGHILQEESPVTPETEYARTKLAAEKIVLGATAEDGAPVGVVLRVGAVYGARIKGNYERLVKALARRRFLPIGKGSNRRTLIYDKDLARAALPALEHPDAAGKLYNVTDGSFHTVREINAAVCEALGRKPPSYSLPAKAVRFAAGILEDLAGIAGCRSPVTRTAIDKYMEDVAVDGKRFQIDLGFRPQYDLVKGWCDAVREMRKSGNL